MASFLYKGKPVVVLSEGGSLTRVYFEDSDEGHAFFVKANDLREAPKKKIKSPLNVDGEYKMPDTQRAYVADLINQAYGRDVVTVKHESRTLAGERLAEQQDKAKAFLLDNSGFFRAPGDGSLVSELVANMGTISIQLPWEMWRWSSHDLDAIALILERQQERAAEREKQQLADEEPNAEAEAAAVGKP
jgi:hypothetical protein